MGITKEIKKQVNQGNLDKLLIVHVVLNYDQRIKYIRSKIEEYESLLKEGRIDNELYLELYIDKYEETKFKRNAVLDSLSPCEIILNKNNYYLKYYIRFSKSEDYILYAPLKEKDLFLYPKLKIRKRRLIKKQYNYEIYSPQFLNKIYEIINSGKYKIININN